jgi:hypothetical protein
LTSGGMVDPHDKCRIFYPPTFQHQGEVLVAVTSELT